MAEIIIVHGAPGAGKTTQCERLASEGLDGRPIQHISVGARIRSIRTGQYISRFSETIIDGVTKPLHDAVVNDVMFETLLHPSECVPELVLFDGYPKQLGAVDLMSKSIENNGHRLLGVIAFKVSEQVSLERLAQRGSRVGEKIATSTPQEYAAIRYAKDQLRLREVLDALGQISTISVVESDHLVDVVAANFRESVKNFSNLLSSQ